MLEKVKTALVNSFVGAIAIGLLFSQGISEVVRLAISPVMVWIQQRQNSEAFPFSSPQAVSPFESMLPQLLRAVFMLLIGYGLLRWLYFPQAEKQDQDAVQESEQGA